MPKPPVRLHSPASAVAAHIAERGLPTRGLGKMLQQCHRAFSTELRNRLVPFDLTISQWAHLRTLWDEDGLSQVALSRQIGIEKASSTAVLDSLEGRGLIRRARNSADRRRSNVYLTPDGTALVREVIPRMLALNAEGLQDLSRAEIDAFLKGLRAMSENLSKARGKRGKKADPRLAIGAADDPPLA